jgi:hypothetical protein
MHCMELSSTHLDFTAMIGSSARLAQQHLESHSLIPDVAAYSVLTSYMQPRIPKQPCTPPTPKNQPLKQSWQPPCTATGSNLTTACPTRTQPRTAARGHGHNTRDTTTARHTDAHTMALCQGLF